MIRSSDLETFTLRAILEPNAPVLLTPPTDAATESWWQIDDGTWVRALPLPELRIQGAEDDMVATVRVRSDGLGLEADSEADWVWTADETMGLSARLLEGLLDQLNRSMPQLPARAAAKPIVEPLLTWQRASDGLSHEARRKMRLLQSQNLLTHSKAVAALAEGDEVGSSPSGHAARLLHHFRAIPRVSKTRLSLAPSEIDGGLVLEWRQEGDPDVLWGARFLTVTGRIFRIKVETRAQDEAQRHRILGAQGQLFAMATAFEAATGGAEVPILFRFLCADNPQFEATLTLGPTDWGFELPSMIHILGRSRASDRIKFYRRPPHRA